MIQPLRQRILAQTNAGTAVNILLPAVKPGQLLHVTHLALDNESGESVTVEFGATEIIGFIRLWAKQTVANGDAVGIMVNFFGLERDQLTAQVTGAALKGPVTFTVAGELMDGQPTPVVVVEAK